MISKFYIIFIIVILFGQFSFINEQSDTINNNEQPVV
jgi:hypothetical protein